MSYVQIAIKEPLVFFFKTDGGGPHYRGEHFEKPNNSADINLFLIK